MYSNINLLTGCIALVNIACAGMNWCLCYTWVSSVYIVMCDFATKGSVENKTRWRGQLWWRQPSADISEGLYIVVY